MTLSEVFEISGVKYQVKKPFGAEYKMAQLEYNKAFGDAIKSGAPLKEKLRDYMVEQGIWTEKKQQEFIDLVKSISDHEQQLEAGGIKLSEATIIAKKLRKNREDLQELLARRATAESNTAEGQAENAKFQRLLTLCLVYKDTGKHVFETIDQLLTENDKEKLEISNKAFDILSNMIYDLDSEYSKKLPENQFLLKFKLINEQLQYVDNDGNPIDEFGNKVDSSGELLEPKKVEPKPFLDDDGNPITQ